MEPPVGGHCPATGNGIVRRKMRFSIAVPWDDLEKDFAGMVQLNSQFKV
jgi:hypothetical protein